MVVGVSGEVVALQVEDEPWYLANSLEKWGLSAHGRWTSIWRTKDVVRRPGVTHYKLNSCLNNIAVSVFVLSLEGGAFLTMR